AESAARWGAAAGSYMPGGEGAATSSPRCPWRSMSGTAAAARRRGRRRERAYMVANVPGARRAGPARVIIADDHELARAGLRSMLAGEPGIEVVGEAATGREALSLARQLDPDLALLDMRMPEMDGLAATRAIKKACPATSVILVTM